MTRKWSNDQNKIIIGDKGMSSNVLFCQLVNFTPEKLEPVNHLLKDANWALLVMCLLLPEALSAAQCCSGSSAQSDIWLNNRVLFVYMVVVWLTALNRAWVGRVEGMTTFEDHQPVLVKTLKCTDLVHCGPTVEMLSDVLGPTGSVFILLKLGWFCSLASVRYIVVLTVWGGLRFLSWVIVLYHCKEVILITFSGSLKLFLTFIWG